MGTQGSPRCPNLSRKLSLFLCFLLFFIVFLHFHPAQAFDQYFDRYFDQYFDPSKNPELRCKTNLGVKIGFSSLGGITVQDHLGGFISRNYGLCV